MDKNNTDIMIVAIIAIVAIVAIVVMPQGSIRHVPAQSKDISPNPSINQNAGGEAFWRNYNSRQYEREIVYVPILKNISNMTGHNSSDGWNHTGGNLTNNTNFTRGRDVLPFLR